MLDHKKQHNINRELRSSHGFTVPLRLLSDTHAKYIVFRDCFISTKCYLSFQDIGQFELFKQCNFGVGTLFLAKNVTYTAKYDFKAHQYMVSFVRIWKNKGSLNPAKGDPEFKYWVDLFQEYYGE
jgi:hypothetical protein